MSQRAGSKRRDNLPLILWSSLIPLPSVLRVYDTVKCNLWSSAILADTEQLISVAFDVVQSIKNNNVILGYFPVKGSIILLFNCLEMQCFSELKRPFLAANERSPRCLWVSQVDTRRPHIGTGAGISRRWCVFFIFLTFFRI